MEKSITDKKEKEVNSQPLIFNKRTTFPQIHTNLNGMVREFVRAMYQDTKGNYWFGTRSVGLSRFDGKTFTTFSEYQHGNYIERISHYDFKNFGSI